MVPALIFSIVCFSIVLVRASDWVIIALRRLGKSTKTGVFALSAVILAIGTSLPEYFIGITSALEKSPSLSLGNIIGANIVNVSLVAGFAALVVGRINISREYLKKDLLIAFFAGVLPLILLFDGILSRVDGLILLATYGAYSTSLFKSKFESIAKEHQRESFIYRFFRKIANINGNQKREMGRLFVGIATLLFSADMIVKIAKILAEMANVPVLLIGLVAVSIGTTLPEIVFALRSVEDDQPTMFLGNLLGSIIANSTLILGTVSLIYPIEVGQITNYFEAVLAFIVIFGLFWVFIRSKHTLERWEGGLLLLIYLAFVVILFN